MLYETTNGYPLCTRIVYKASDNIIIIIIIIQKQNKCLTIHNAVACGCDNVHEITSEC